MALNLVELPAAKSATATAEYAATFRGINDDRYRIDWPATRGISRDYH